MSLTRTTNMMFELPFRMLEFPFLLSAAFIDAMVSESRSQREDSHRSREREQGSRHNRHRRHHQANHASENVHVGPHTHTHQAA